jgi:transcription initiation factor TFIID TATA-box-binding protein
MNAATGETRPTETIAVENVVGTADLGHEFDLATLAMDLPKSEYTPESFHGVIYKTEDPTVTVMVFRSGKVTISGAATSTEVGTAFERLVADLRDLEIAVGNPSETTIRNIVATADFGARMNLNAVAIGLGLERIEYEPEQFPGLVYRLDAPEAVLLLFGTGKAVITGATERTTIETAVETVTDQLGDLGFLAD